MNIHGRHNNRGLTLVELLVVLSIIGLLASISVPLVMRMGPTPTRTIETASRELFALLKGARIYATTFNVETVVSYSLDLQIDSITNLPCPVLDSVALGRLMSREERSTPAIALTLLNLNVSPSARVYVPVKNSEGRFNPMRGGTCIISQECFGVGSWLGYLDDRGMTPVILFDLDSLEAIEPRFVQLGSFEGGVTPLYGELGRRFPAHVFLPSGGMRNNSSRQRARLSVGLLPSADPNDRLTIAYDPVTGAPLIDANTGGPQETPLTVELTLYKAQGRIKVEPR